MRSLNSTKTFQKELMCLSGLLIKIRNLQKKRKGEGDQYIKYIYQLGIANIDADNKAADLYKELMSYYFASKKGGKEVTIYKDALYHFNIFLKLAELKGCDIPDDLPVKDIKKEIKEYRIR